MATVTILNGPPGCGKDTLAKLVAERTGAYHGEFKSILYRETAAYYGVSLPAFKKNATNRSLKEQPIYNTITGLKSPRDMLINVSENIIKPKFGSDYFGLCAASDWYDIDQPKIISDGGFVDEIKPLIDMFGRRNVLIIQLKRDGYSFDGDSRSYISEHHVNCAVRYVHLHEGEIGKAYNKVIQLMQELERYAS